MKKLFDIDFIGMGASILCLVHCLCLPWLVAIAGTFFGSYVESPHFHNAMLIISILIGLPVFVTSFMKYKSKLILFTGVVGLTLTTLGTIQEDNCCPSPEVEVACETSCLTKCDSPTTENETPLTLDETVKLQGFNTIPLGVIFLILAHFLNFRKKKSCSHACCN